jgi:hypothetical protein
LGRHEERVHTTAVAHQYTVASGGGRGVGREEEEGPRKSQGCQEAQARRSPS